ncbi:MAG: SixA phosphatase family protein [Phycisphaerales bacterium]
MRLYIVRHGKAERDSASGLDRDRALRPRGERQARWLADQWAQALPGERPGLVLSSGYVRAMETAKIIVGVLACPLIHARELEIGHSAAAAAELVARRAGASAGRTPLVLVGHNPQLEHLLALLVTLPGGEAPAMRTGEAAVLELPEGVGQRAHLLGTLRVDDGD